jgi:hypothetical protein
MHKTAMTYMKLESERNGSKESAGAVEELTELEVGLVGTDVVASRKYSFHY